MIVAIIIVVWFYRLADNKNQNKFLWPALALVSYFVMQFVLGIFLGIFSPRTLEEPMMVILLSIISGGLGVWLIYVVMNRVAANNNSASNKNSDLIDDSF